MMRTVVSMKHIEPPSVWVILTESLRPREGEFRKAVLQKLQYVRFRSFASTHLMVICEQYSYAMVEDAVDEVLSAMRL